MARIVIKDLKESVELDRAAMRQITGGWSGSRLRGLPGSGSGLFQKPDFFTQFNPAGVNFDLNRR